MPYAYNQAKNMYVYIYALYICAYVYVAIALTQITYF